MDIIDNSPNRFSKTYINGCEIIVRSGIPIEAVTPESLVPKENTASSRFANVFTTVLDIDGRRIKVYVKQFLYRSNIDRLKHLLRNSRAERSLSAAKMLCENGFNSPKIIAVVQKKKGPVCTENILITEELNDAKSIYDREKDFIDNAKFSVSDKREFVRQLAGEIGKLHAKNISHGDLRPGNIFAEKDRDKWRFYFLDNERTVRYKKLPLKLRIKNLVQINMLANRPFGLTDRIRFYKEYIRQNPALKDDRIELLREIATISRRRMKKIFRQEQVL